MVVVIWHIRIRSLPVFEFCLKLPSVLFQWCTNVCCHTTNCCCCCCWAGLHKECGFVSAYGSVFLHIGIFFAGIVCVGCRVSENRAISYKGYSQIMSIMQKKRREEHVGQEKTSIYTWCFLCWAVWWWPSVLISQLIILLTPNSDK